MASGAEILSYKGDPNLALGSSQLPASSSVYVSDFDKAYDFWQNYTQRKFIADKAKWDQNNLERAANQKRIEDAINLGNYNIWDVDRDDFMDNYYKPMNDMILKNPSAFYDSSNPEYFKAMDILGKAKQAAAFSTQQKAEYDTQSKFEQLHPNEIRNLGASEQYKNAGGIMKRAEMGGINFDHNFELNLLADQDKLIKTIQYDNPTLEVTTGKFGNDLYTITQEPNLENTRKIIEAEYDSGLNNQRAIQQMISDDPSIMANYDNPKDMYITMRIAGLPLDEKTKVELRGRNFPSAAALKPPEGSDQGYLNEAIRRMQNGDQSMLNAFSGTIDGHLVKSVKYTTTDVSNLIKQRDDLYAERDKQSTKEGKDDKQKKIDVLTDQIAATKNEPLTIKIEFSDSQKPLVIPVPEAKDGQQGGAYFTLNALLRKVEKENNLRIQDVTGDIFSKPEPEKKTGNQKTVTSPKKSYNLTELKKTVDFGKMSDSEIIQWYKTNHPEIEITK